MKSNEVLDAILIEAQMAQAKYGDYASMHEGLGVLAEEFAELVEAVRLKGDGRQRRIREEAIQVSAVALRMAVQAERVTR